MDDGQNNSDDSDARDLDTASHDTPPVDTVPGDIAAVDSAVDSAADDSADGLLETSVSTEPVSQTLNEALDRLQIELPADQVQQLEQYCRLMWDWNEKINLTRHVNYDLFARRDLVDSMQLASVLAQKEEVLDVGTGGGVPGILLAILRPDLDVSLCDNVGKKARVCDDIVKKMKLPVPVHAHRVQDVLEDFRYDSLVIRAVGSIEKICQWLDKHWYEFGRLLAIKGPRWIEERGAARHRGLLKGIQLRKIHAYPMPGTDSESVILQMIKPRPGQDLGSLEDEE